MLYYFNIKDGREIIDEVGTELSSIAEVRAEAVATGGRIIAELGNEFWDHPVWTMTVTDADKTVVLTLTFAGKQH